MARLTLILALWLLTSTAEAQLTRDAVGNGRSALETQLTSGARTRTPSTSGSEQAFGSVTEPGALR